jgi:RecB family exonuclease
MVEEAMRDPISLAMLKIDGKRIMEVCEIPPGPKIGHILHAIFNEVLEKPELNTQDTLEQRARGLSLLSEAELKALGEAGIIKKREEDKKDVEEIRKKYHVS